MGADWMRILFVPLLLSGVVLIFSAEAVTPQGNVAQLQETAMSGDGGCAAAARICQAEAITQKTVRDAGRASLAQCRKAAEGHQNTLVSFAERQTADLRKLAVLQGHVKRLAEEATAEEAKQEGMELGDMNDDIGEDKTAELMEANTSGGLPGIKDALQKAEAVLAYNEIQADRKFKEADKLASDATNLSKKGMQKVRMAAQAAAKASSNRIVAEVQVTKLKAALQAAQKLKESKNGA